MATARNVPLETVSPRFIYLALSCAAVLTGCAATDLPSNVTSTSGVSSWPATQVVHQRVTRKIVDPSIAESGLYVALSGEYYMLDYRPANRKNRQAKCAVVTGNGIMFITTDADGTVWVPNWSLGTVRSFAPDCGPEGLTLKASGIHPMSVAIAKDGTKFVVGDSSSACWIYKYPKGSASPSDFLTASGLSGCVDIKVDSKGNAYASTQAGLLYKFRRGTTPGEQIALPDAPSDSGMTFDPKDNLIMIDRANGRVEIWSPPYKATPRTFKLLASSVFACALNASSTRLACTNSSDTEPTIDVYDYPSGKYRYSFNSGLFPRVAPSGIAFYAHR